MKVLLAITVVLGLSSMASLTVAQEDVAASPLDEITHDMKVSANQLSKRVTAKPTQEPQKDAVDKLDALIAKLEEERQRLQQGGQITANPSSPADSSTVRTGPGGMGDLHGVRDQKERWGDLPAHERDRILQSLTEGFPTHYQAILEAYYKRLATERPTDDAEEPPALRTPPRKAADKTSAAKPAAMPAKSSPAMKGRK